MPIEPAAAAPAEAAQPEPSPAVVTPPPPAPSCQNCEVPLDGPFCAQCGQRADTHVPALTEVGHDIVHSVLHLDGRVWRTLRSLLFRPGELTNEYIRGRRQRYLPPFRLYLVVSVAFFAISSLLPNDGLVQVADRPGSVEAPIVVGGKQPEKPAGPAVEGTSPEAVRGMVAVETPANCAVDTGLPALDARLGEACRKIAADRGKRLGQVFFRTAPKLMFAFLPVMAAVSLLFYWRPRRRYVEHLVLYFHTHSLTFLALLASSLVGLLGRPGLPGAGLFELVSSLLVAWVPYYVFRAMRVVYGESRRRTLAKFVTIGSIYVTLLGITMIAGVIYSGLSL